MADLSAKVTHETPTHDLAELFSLSQDWNNPCWPVALPSQMLEIWHSPVVGKAELPSALCGLHMQSCHTLLG